MRYLSEGLGKCRVPGAGKTHYRSEVPKLTRSVAIQLNERVSLRRSANAVSVLAPDIAPHPVPCVAKPSGDHNPLCGFV